MTHDFVLSNTEIDEFVRELQNWKIVSQQYPRVFIESVGYQSAAAQQLTIEHVLAEEIRIPQMDKRSRLSLVSPLIEQGKVFFPKSGAEVLVDQLLNFGVEKYDDQVDAFTLLLSKVIETDRSTSRSTSSEPQVKEPDPHPGLTWINANTYLGHDLTPISLDMEF